MSHLVSIAHRQAGPRMGAAMLPLLIFGCTSTGVLDGNKPSSGGGGSHASTGGWTGGPADAPLVGGGSDASASAGGATSISTGGWTSTDESAPASTGGTWGSSGGSTSTG